MTKHYIIHPDNPQQRLINQVVEDLKSGAVVVVPTDCCYALCCPIGDQIAQKKIAKIRGYADDHMLALLLPDISQASLYARIEDMAFKLLKKATPGPYTFILPANITLPKRLHLKRKTIGIRIPNNNILLDVLRTYGEPLYSSTLWLPGDEFPHFEPEVIKEQFHNIFDVIIDGGLGSPEMSTVVSLLDKKVEIIRHGKGDAGILEY